MNLKPKTFIIVSACYLLLFCLLYYACFLLQCGKYIKAEWWLKDTLVYKQYLSRIIPSPRIIIIGGSNALFGVDSSVIEKITGYNVVNLATHGALDLNFHYITLKENMGKGDIVVMPLEYTYYFMDQQTDWFTDNMMAWGYEYYLSRINPVELVRFLYHVPKKRIYEGLLKKTKKKPLADENLIIYSIVNSVYSGWNGYNFQSLDKHGEINVDEGPDEHVLKLKNGGRQYMRETELSGRFLDFFNNVRKLAEKRDGRVILTWPVSIRNKEFDLSVPSHQQLVNTLADNLKKESIPIECDPGLFNMDYRFFFNSEYHLNKKGALVRSEKLGRCINDIIR